MSEQKVMVSSVKVVQKFLTNNPCYKAGKKITVKGLMLHSVGCPQPRASIFIENWNKESFDRACVHAFIDGNDGTVYQTLPWNHRGWHGGGSSNNTHIGVEMCEPACINYVKGSTFTCSNLDEAKTVTKRTYEAAVELFAMLCKEYDLDPLGENVILSHSEGYKKGMASNHGDPEHLWKQLDMGYTMDGFRKAVKAAMTTTVERTEKVEKWYRVRKTWKDAKTQKGAYKTLKNAKTCADKNAGYSVYDWDGNVVYTPVNIVKEQKVNYRVRVQIDDLNIRKGPGTHFAKTGDYTGKGVFTIVAECIGLGSDKGWGKLKSGAGWISLDFVKRI